MSLPTNPYEDQAWWRAAMAGEKPSLEQGDAHVGWYKQRKHKDGPWVPVVVWRDSPVDDDGDLIDDETLVCKIDGALISGDDLDERFTWFCLYPIAPKDYTAMINGTETPETATTLAEAKPVF